MTKLSMATLADPEHYQLLEALGHKDLAPFVATYYWRRRSWLTWAHYLFSAATLALWIWVSLQRQLGFDAWLTSFGYAVISFVALVPIHEWIHGAVYKLLGAADVRYSFSWRQFYAYAIAHQFVADQREFAWVAVTPFLVINASLAIAALALAPLQFWLIGVLLVHTAGTSGDFAMLNYLWLTRNRAVYTFDDAVSHTTYFYARHEQV